MVWGKVAQLSEHLVTREKETIAASSSAAVLEAYLKPSLKRYYFPSIFPSLKTNSVFRNIAKKAN